MSTFPIIKTKLSVPARADQAIERALARQIGVSSPSRRLTLLTAPAGYGKTSIAAQWAGLTDATTVWLTLDRSDNLSHRLLLNLVGGFAQAGIIPDTGERHPAGGSSTEWLWARLLNGLYDYKQPVCLILDDSDCLKSHHSWAVVEDLLRKAPANLSVVVAGRRRPALNLARFLAADELTEIDSRGLAFTVEEIERVLKQRALPGGTGEAYHLHSKTEGWPVGVLLLISAFERLRNRQTLTLGDKRVYETAIDWLRDYLIREVLEHLPAEFQSFILRTAHVHAFNEGLAAELTSDVQAGKVIPALERQHGLLSLLSSGDWWCYHPMFRAAFCLIAQERQGAELAQLQEKAATWLLQAGHFGEGLYHYAACHSLPSLLRMIEKHAFDLLREGEVNDIADTLLNIPATVSHDHYVLAMIEASVVHVSKDVPRIKACINRLQALSEELPGSGNPVRLRQSIAYLRSQDHYLGGRFNSSILACSEELDADPSTDPLSAAMSVLRVHRANGYHALGRLQPAYEDALQAYDELEKLELSGYTHAVSMLLGQIELSQGRLEQAEQRFAGALGELSGSAPGARNFYDVFSVAGLGLVRREQNRFDEAATLLTEAINIAHKFKPSAALPWVFHHIAMTAWAQGNKPRARELFREGQRQAFRSELHVVYRLLGAYRVRLEMETDGALCGYARTWAREWEELACKGRQDIMPEEHLAMAWLRHYQGDGADALKRCEDVMALTRSNRQIDLLVDSLLLKACILREGGALAHAMKSLNGAISVARDHGLQSLFFREGRGLIDLCKLGMSRKKSRDEKLTEPLLDAAFVQDLLTAQVDASAEAYRSPKLLPFEPVTKRERDVLGLMANGRNNQEIADALFVSVSTVKSHVNSIFKKLEVATREDACALADQFQLLS